MGSRGLNSVDKSDYVPAPDFNYEVRRNVVNLLLFGRVAQSSNVQKTYTRAVVLVKIK